MFYIPIEMKVCKIVSKCTRFYCNYVTNIRISYWQKKSIQRTDMSSSLNDGDESIAIQVYPIILKVNAEDSVTIM